MLAPLTQLALEIADENASAIVDCNCVAVRDKKQSRWYIFNSDVAKEVRYLQMRGLVEVHRRNPSRFRVALP